MEIKLYQVTCDPKVIDKTSYLGTATTFTSCSFKGFPVSIKNPVLILTGITTANIFNYCYIVSLDKYYFIDRYIILDASRFELYLTEDVLFTFKTKIKNASGFIKRSTSAGNKLIQDNLDCFKESETITYVSPSMLTICKEFTNIVGANCNYLIAYFDGHMDDTAQYPESNTYITSVNYNDGIIPYIAGNKSRMGYGTNTNYRLLNNTQLELLARRVGNDSQLLSYIKGIYILPFNMSSNTSAYAYYPYITTNDVSFYLGTTLIDVNYDAGNTKVKAPYYYLTRAKTYDYKYEIQSPSYEDYLKKYEIWCAFVGWVEIPPAQFINKRLYVFYHFDFENGSSTCNIYDVSSDTIIYTSSANMLTSISLSAENMRALQEQKTALTLNTIIGSASSILAIAGGIYTHNPVTTYGGVLSAAKVASNAVTGFSQLHGTGNVHAVDAPSSNEFPFLHKIRITSKDVIKADTAKFGLPVNRVATLYTLTGYVEVSDLILSDNSGVTKEELDEIKLLLEKGAIIS